MNISPRAIRNLKDTLLIVSVLYFYGLALALQFHRETYGLDRPAVFLGICMIFFSALVLETVLVWWNKKVFLFWLALGIVAYGVIGLYVAPTFYGPSILVYVLLEPLIIAFVGGFAFSIGHVVSRGLSTARKLTSQQVATALSDLPGWRHVDNAIQKTYAFDAFSEALNFVNRIALIAEETRHLIEFHLSGGTVTLALTTTEVNGVTLKDIQHARRFDAGV